MKTDKEKHGLRGPVKRVQIETAQFEKEDEQFVERPWFGHTLVFNRDGRLTEHVNRNPDGSEWRTVNDYSASGKLLATRSYDPSGALCGEMRIIYDAEGRLIAEQHSTLNSVATQPTTYVYDEAGRRTKIEELESPGEANWLIGIEGTKSSIGANGAKRIETRYDERGEAVEVKIFNADGRLVSRMTITRDEHGNPLEETRYAGETASFDSCSPQACSTEALAELTEEQRAEVEAELARLFAPGTAMSRHVHTYDTKGRLIESKLTMMGMEAGHQKLVYDEDGNQIEEASYNEDGTLAYKAIFTREYDQHGNWTKELVSTASSWDAEFNLSSPANVTRRTISYYE